MRIIRHSLQTKPQREFWNAPERFRLFSGGVGSGKTRAGVIEAMRRPRGSTGMVLAPTYPMLRDATLRTFLDIVKAAGVLRSFNKSEMRAELGGDRTVIFRTADNPERLRGPNLGWFWLDEAAMMPRMVWLIMIGRLREQPALAWATSTPKGKNWLYKEFSKDDGRHRIIRASSRTNPFLPADFIRSMEDTYDPEFARQEVGGEFLDEALGGLLKDTWVDRMATTTEFVEKLRAQGKGGRRRLSADLGEGTGRDNTVLLVRDDLGILALEVSDRVGIPEAAVAIDRLARAWGVRQEDIVYDAGGRGKDLPRYLEQHRITEAIPYHGSGKGGNRYFNKRSRVAWALRQRLDPERPESPRILVPPPDWKPSPFDPPRKDAGSEIQPPFSLPAVRPWWALMSEELKALKYSMEGAKVKLEIKADLAKTLGRSPDLLDALLMSFAVGDD